MRCILTLLFLVLASLNIAQAQEAVLLSGPMVGHTTDSSAAIWIETSRPAAVRVRYWVDAGPRPLSIQTAEGSTTDSAPHTGVVTINDLPASAAVHYELELNGTPIRPQTPQVFTVPPAESRPGITGATPSFSVAFASCMSIRNTPIQPIWTQLAIYRPTLLMLIGDNNYMPNHDDAYETSEGAARHVMARSHRYLRDLPGLRTMLATTPTYSIWDDHDFGPNNADRTFRWRELSLELFKRYWPNPAAGTPATPGIFYAFRVADVEFFMLDNRYYRDPNDDPNRRTMLGASQLDWLKARLKASTATFKVIVSGGMMLTDKRNNSEYWARYGDERDRFLHWMYDEDISGVFFVSGDIHRGSLARVEFTRDGYPLWEVASSNAGYRYQLGQNELNRQQSGINRRMQGPVVDDVYEYNFGAMEFSGPPGDRVATLKVIDYHGQIRIVQRLTEKNLSSRWNE